MAAPVGPKKVHRYTVEFKIQAVRLSLHPEIQTQDVAHALDIHPFMLSKWKKDYREGKKVLRAPKRDAEKRALRRQVRQLEAKVAARTQARSLERKLAALVPTRTDPICMESFFHSLKAELTHRRSFTSDAELNASVAGYIDRFYNEKRIHSSLGYHSPVEFECLANA